MEQLDLIRPEQAEANTGECPRCHGTGAFYDGMKNGAQYALRCDCGAKIDQRRGFRFEPGAFMLWRSATSMPGPSGTCDHDHPTLGDAAACALQRKARFVCVYAPLDSGPNAGMLGHHHAREVTLPERPGDRT